MKPEDRTNANGVGDLGRLAVKDWDFVADVAREVFRARAKFPTSFGSMVALTEEVGELAKALLDEPWANVRKEAIQVACMAMRVAIEGDPSLHRIREGRGLDEP